MFIVNTTNINNMAIPYSIGTPVGEFNLVDIFTNQNIYQGVVQHIGAPISTGFANIGNAIIVIPMVNNIPMLSAVQQNSVNMVQPNPVIMQIVGALNNLAINYLNNNPALANTVIPYQVYGQMFGLQPQPQLQPQLTPEQIAYQKQQEEKRLERLRVEKELEKQKRERYKNIVPPKNKYVQAKEQAAKEQAEKEQQEKEVAQNQESVPVPEEIKEEIKEQETVPEEIKEQETIQEQVQESISETNIETTQEETQVQIQAQETKEQVQEETQEAISFNNIISDDVEVHININPDVIENSTSSSSDEMVSIQSSWDRTTEQQDLTTSEQVNSAQQEPIDSEKIIPLIKKGSYIEKIKALDGVVIQHPAVNQNYFYPKVKFTATSKLGTDDFDVFLTNTVKLVQDSTYLSTETKIFKEKLENMLLPYEKINIIEVITLLDRTKLGIQLLHLMSYLEVEPSPTGMYEGLHYYQYLLYILSKYILKEFNIDDSVVMYDYLSFLSSIYSLRTSKLWTNAEEEDGDYDSSYDDNYDDDYDDDDLDDLTDKDKIGEDTVPEVELDVTPKSKIQISRTTLIKQILLKCQTIEDVKNLIYQSSQGSKIELELDFLTVIGLKRVLCRFNATSFSIGYETGEEISVSVIAYHLFHYISSEAIYRREIEALEQVEKPVYPTYNEYFRELKKEEKVYNINLFLEKYTELPLVEMEVQDFGIAMALVSTMEMVNGVKQKVSRAIPIATIYQNKDTVSLTKKYMLLPVLLPQDIYETVIRKVDIETSMPMKNVTNSKFLTTMEGILDVVMKIKPNDNLTALAVAVDLDKSFAESLADKSLSKALLSKLLMFQHDKVKFAFLQDDARHFFLKEEVGMQMFHNIMQIYLVLTQQKAKQNKK